MPGIRVATGRRR